MSRQDEEAFFVVLYSNDIWKEFRKWMYPNKKTSNFYDYRSGNLAIKYGYLGLIRESTNLCFTFLALNEAAKVSNLDILLFIHKHKLYNTTNYIFDDVVKYGTETTLKYLCSCSPDERIKGTTLAIDNAARNGNYNMVKLLHNQGMKCTSLAIDNASEFGYLNIVRFLYFNVRANCSNSAMNMAAKKGHIKVVRFLYNNLRESCNLQEALKYAKESRNKEVAKYLLKLETPTYDIPTC